MYTSEAYNLQETLSASAKTNASRKCTWKTFNA